jgi:hypothetical protein
LTNQIPVVVSHGRSFSMTLPGSHYEDRRMSRLKVVWQCPSQGGASTSIAFEPPSLATRASYHGSILQSGLAWSTVLVAPPTLLLTENENDFCGEETFVRDGTSYILGSDRDDGLWIFKRTDS